MISNVKLRTMNVAVIDWVIREAYVLRRFERNISKEETASMHTSTNVTFNTARLNAKDAKEHRMCTHREGVIPSLLQRC